jgi:hypothetical protein
MMFAAAFGILSMLHTRTRRRLTQASIFNLLWGAWSGWSFIAQDRELRFVAVELPPPIA